MQPRSAKAKGRTAQNLVRDKLRAAFPSLHPNDLKSQTMGMPGEDIVQSQLAKATTGISIEVKARKAFSVLRHYDQAVSNKEDREPILVIKEDRCRGKMYAVMDFDYYLTLIEEKPDGTKKTD